MWARESSVLSVPRFNDSRANQSQCKYIHRALVFDIALFQYHHPFVLAIHLVKQSIHCLLFRK